MKNHITRWITGLIAGPLIFVFVIYSSEIIFFFFILAVIQIAVWEYNLLVFNKHGYLLEKGEVFIFAFIIPLAIYLGDGASLKATLTFCSLVTFLIFLLQIKSAEIDLSKIGKVILGFMYLPLFLSYFISLRNLNDGTSWVIFTIAMVFVGDISAFYIGRTFGEKKLQPFVSYGKTIEGTIGQITGSLLGSILVQLFFFPKLSLKHAITIGVLGGILAQLGDLFESAIKRAAGVKDSGFIFPGHGGILDRIDSLSFLAPFIFYYQHFVIT